MPDSILPDVLSRPVVVRPVVVHVCTSCRGGPADEEAERAGSRLHRALAAREAADLRVVPVACLGNCNRGCTVALQATGGVSGSPASWVPPSWTYVFGDLAPQCSAEIEAAARLLGSAPDGLMPWRGRPEPFKRGLIARIPPLASQDAA